VQQALYAESAVVHEVGSRWSSVGREPERERERRGTSAKLTVGESGDGGGGLMGVDVGSGDG
jgi:hypothetical protein